MSVRYPCRLMKMRFQQSVCRFRLQGAASRGSDVRGSGFKIEGSGCRVWRVGLWLRVLGLGLRVGGVPPGGNASSAEKMEVFSRRGWRLADCRSA